MLENNVKCKTIEKVYEKSGLVKVVLWWEMEDAVRGRPRNYIIDLYEDGIKTQTFSSDNKTNYEIVTSKDCNYYFVVR